MLTQTAVYAVRAMVFIASKNDGKPVLAQTIADKMRIPKNFLSKILLRLVREGFIHSMRGTNGGFTLAKKAKEIRLRDIVSPFMDVDNYKTCFLGLDECMNNGLCKIHKQWVPILSRFEKLLDKTTIDQVF